MKFSNMWRSQSGQVSRFLLVMAVVILVAVVIVYLVLRMAEKPARPAQLPEDQIPQPVYETSLGNVRFVFQSAVDLGNVLDVSQAKEKTYTYQKNLTTGEKFVQVTVGGQNTGTENLPLNYWDLGVIVDSENRRFVPLDDYAVKPWLPLNNYCGILLKPAFDPAPCTKIYEVSKQSTGLKIEVLAGSGGLGTGNNQSALLDLIVK